MHLTNSVPSTSHAEPTSEDQENLPLPSGPIVPVVVANEVKKVVQIRKNKGIVCIHGRLDMCTTSICRVYICVHVYMYVYDVHMQGCVCVHLTYV